jgi:hypothetical protein
MDTNQAETMTTSEVADYLKIAFGSVANTLKRRGIRPLHRTPGMGGQSVWDAAAVRGTLPKPLVVDADLRDLAFVPVDGRCGRVVTVTVVEVVKGAPDMEWSRGRFCPSRITASFTSDNGGAWTHTVTVKGYRRRADNSLGADDAYAYAGIDPTRDPVWVTNWIDTRTPSDDQK